MMIKFVQYTGRYPNLCSGTLTLDVDGRVYTFKDVLRSGGSIVRDPEYDLMAVAGEWKVDLYEHPELASYQQEIENLVNEHVQHGCCGGCI